MRFYLKGDIDNGDISDLLKIPKNNVEYEKITEFLDSINVAQNNSQITELCKNNRWDWRANMYRFFL